MPAKIAVIIITHNARPYLPDCLASVFGQDYPQNALRVLVIDNNSTDSTVGYIQEAYPQARLVENHRNRGFAEANNQGYFLAQKWRADYVFLLNQDTIMEKNCLTRLVGLAQSDEKIAAVQAKLLLHPEKDLINSFGNSIHFLGFAFCNHYREPDKKGIVTPFELPYPSGAACLVKMSALKETGLFDGRLFMYHEDVDLGWRLCLAGYRVMLDPLAVVYHKYNYGKAKYKFYYMERNRWVVLLENYRLPTLVVLAPALIVMEIGIFFISIKNGWFWQKLKGSGWILFHLPSILSRRLESRFCVRKIKDRDILKRFVGSIRFQEVDSPLLARVVNPLTEIYFWLAKKIIFW